MIKVISAKGSRMADAERQYTWRTESLAKLIEARKQRLVELERRERDIQRTLDAYRDLPGNGVNFRVELCREFVGLQAYWA